MATPGGGGQRTPRSHWLHDLSEEWVIGLLVRAKELSASIRVATPVCNEEMLFSDTGMHGKGIVVLQSGANWVPFHKELRTL